MKQEHAIDIGQAALIWLAGQQEALEGFLGASGADAADLRRGATDPVFLGFVLDYILQSDALVLGFAGDTDTPPDRPARARAALPGGDHPNWT